MQKINDILKWYFKPSKFNYKAKHLFLNETKEQVENSIKTVKHLTKKLSDGNNIPQSQHIEDVYDLFIRNASGNFSKLSSLFTGRKIRILLWALDFQSDKNSQVILYSKEFKIAKKLILNKWKDSFITILWHVLLKNWVILDNFKKQKQDLQQLLLKKCKSYNKNRESILNISKNIILFVDKNATQKYAEQLLEKKIPINEANLLINKKETVLQFQYFAEVLQKHIEIINETHVNDENLNSIYSLLSKHNNRRTSLIASALLINNKKFDPFLEKLKNQTLNLIGDPTRKYLWQYNDFTKEEAKNVENARKKLEILLNKDLLTVFFETLVEDPRRKKYWIKFINEINNIKFVGNKSNYQYLKSIDTISKHVDRKYKITGSNQNTCALIIYLKNYVFVEFSDIGALYVYKEENFYINLKSVSQMSGLKLWKINKIICKNNPEYSYHSYYSRSDIKFLMQEEGRLTHAGNWEIKLDKWMEKYCK